MRILVTGGAGFIGSHVADLYIKEGHQVTVLDDLSTGSRKNLNKKAKFQQVSITDSASLKRIFSRGKFDIVNHHAAQKNLRFSVKEPILDAQINIIGSLNLLENSIKYKVKKFIFASTGGALYGDTDVIPTPEDHQTDPISPYGVAKLSIEKYLNFYAHQYGLKYTTLRYANVYGPRQDPKGEAGVVAIFITKILKGQQPIINGSGRQTRDYVYVKDVAQANLQALEAKAQGVYNIGTAKQTSVNQLFDQIVSAIGVKVQKKHGPPALGEQMASSISYKKAKKQLGWQPKTSLKPGIEQTVAWFLDNN